MIERVIENWLTNSREREYQLAFCQVLAAEGQTVIYISPHSQLEHGRDIVTVDADGVYRGYQLKAGKGSFSQADWQEIQKEVDQLVRFLFHHPSCTGPVHLQPFLVTTKRLTDPASSAIAHENELWAAGGFKKLQVVQLDELVKRFVVAQGVFLPDDPADLDFFLRMYIKEGAAPLDKSGFAKFMHEVLGFADVDMGAKDAKSAVGSSVIFASYLLSKHMSANNHWAVFEGWSMTLLYALAVQSKFGLSDKVLLPSVELCHTGILRALDSIWDECKSNSNNFVEGDPLVDGLFWRVRMSILVGLTAIRYLMLKVMHLPVGDHDQVLEFLKKHVPESRVSGEGSIPYLYAASVCLELLGQSDMAASVITSLLKAVVQTNGTRGQRGFPNPYYGVEDASRLLWGLEPHNSEVFTGGSYCAQALVHFLARRKLRDPLVQLWQPLTFLNLVQVKPEEEWEWLLWKTQNASLQMNRAGRPQSWAALEHESSTVERGCLPTAIVSKPIHALFLAVVMPHRFGIEIAAVIDDELVKAVSAI